MRAIESSHADRQLVCRIRSQRVIKPKMDTDYNYDYQAQSASSTKATRPYDLNKMKSLQKRQEACSRSMFTSQERANGQLRLTLSTAAYEVFCATVAKLYSSNSIHHEFRDFYAKHKSNTDRSGTAVVDENYRIFNRTSTLKNGNCGQRLKFTIKVENLKDQGIIAQIKNKNKNKNKTKTKTKKQNKTKQKNRNRNKKQNKQNKKKTPKNQHKNKTKKKQQQQQQNAK